MNDFEKLKIYKDKFFLLKFRKFIFLMYLYIKTICYNIVKHPFFEFCSIMIIISNSIILMMDNPNSPEKSLSDKTEFHFMILYTVEIGLKIIGLGLIFGKNSLIKDKWNLFDFLIILSSWINFILKDTNVNFSPLRTLRVLRPLKTISTIKKLKNLILTIFRSIPYLLDILFILFFVYLIFAIAGLHLFNGIMKKRCFDKINNVMLLPTLICSTDSICPNGYICQGNFKNPDWGVTNFDNFGSSFLMVFQITTLEGWYPIMLKLLNGFSGIFDVIIIFYFISLVFIGNFFILNLMLAVINYKFNETQGIKAEDNANMHHQYDCICEEGINFNKVKVCGYYENISRIDKDDLDYDMNDFFFNSTKKRRDKKSHKYSKNNISKNSISDLSKISWANKEDENLKIYDNMFNEKIENQKFEEDKISEENKKNIKIKINKAKKSDFLNVEDIKQKKMAKMSSWIKSYNKLVSSMSKESNFNPIHYKLDGDDKNTPFKRDRKRKNLQKKNTKDEKLNKLAKIQKKNNLLENEEENKEFKKEILENILKFTKQNKQKSFEQNFDFLEKIDNKIKISKRHKSQFINFYKFGKNKEKKKILDKKTIKNLNKFQKIKIKYLKLYADSCKVYNPLYIFDSRNDVIPSLIKKKKDLEQLKKKEKLKSSGISMIYKSKEIINKIKFKRNYKKVKEELERRNIGQNTVNYDKYAKNLSKNYYSSFLNNYVKKSKGDYSIPEHLTIPDQYYPLFTSKKKIITNNKIHIKKNNNKLEIKNSKNNQNEAKKIKQTCKSLINLSVFFQEEFKIENSSCHEAEAKKRAFEITYKNILEDDLKNSAICRHNWSGFDVMGLKKLTMDKFESIVVSLNNEESTIWIPGFWGKIIILRKYCEKIAISKAFENFFLILVLLNTLLLCLDGLIDKKYENITTQINIYLNLIFAFEMVFKIFGMGFKKYSSDSFNIFDAIIVILSLAEYIIKDGVEVKNAFKVIKIFRAIRVLRVTRLLRSLRFMKVIIDVIMRSLEQFTYIAMLLLLLIVIFSLIGMQMFGGKFTFYEEGEIKRQNFDHFGNAFLSVFQILTLENWNDILYLTMRSDQNSFLSVLYLIAWIFIGNYIILNLFLAILLDGFTNVSTSKNYNEIQNEDKILENLINEQKIYLQKKYKENKKKMKILEEIGNIDYEIKNKSNQNSLKKSLSNNSLQSNLMETNSVSSSLDDSGEDEIELIKVKNRLKMKVDIYLNIHCETSLFLFTKKNFIRRNIAKLVTNPIFEKIVIAFIIMSSIQLVVSTYEEDSWKDTFLKKFLTGTDFFFNICFIIECLMKIITYGFFLCENSYLSDSWSRIDFFIVISSIFDMIFNNDDLGFIKVIKVIRTLRPLRFLTHYENLRIVVVSLMESISGIINVLIVILMVMIMFGILGINLLEGKMGYCFRQNESNYYGINYNTCGELGGTWKNFGWNFDNIINALITLFILSSFEGWPNIMFSAMDSDVKEVGPSFQTNYYIFIFFLAFIFIGGLFLMNLFVGVIFFQFTAEQDKEKNKRFKFVTNEQIKWILMQKLILKAKPKIHRITPPKNKIRKFLHKIVLSKAFETIIMIFILLNIISMACIYDTQSDYYSDVMSKINLIFTFIFILEAILKILALGPKSYFSVSWNQFDFSIALSTIVDLIVTNILDIQSLSIYPQLARLLRLLRITRLFKLMKSKQFESFNKIIKTLIFSFPALFNVLLLLILIYFIFSILGVFIFKSDKIGFDNFGVTFIELFRYSTGEDWHVGMYKFAENNPIVGRIYFLVFVFFSSFILVNMFVLIVIQQFENFYFNPDNPINIFEDISDNFRKVWSLFSINDGKKIKNGDIYHFFICLEAPLGYYHSETNPLKRKKIKNFYNRDDFNLDHFIKNLRYNPNYVRRKIANMNLLIDEEGNVSFGQVLHASMKNAFGNKTKTFEYETVKNIQKLEKETINKIIKKNYKNTKNKKNNLIKKKIVNPFTNLLFIKLIYQSWYNYTKKKMKHLKKIEERKLKNENLKNINGFDKIKEDNFHEDNSNPNLNINADNKHDLLTVTEESLSEFENIILNNIKTPPNLE